MQAFFSKSENFLKQASVAQHRHIIAGHAFAARAAYDIVYVAQLAMSEKKKIQLFYIFDFFKFLYDLL